VVEYNDIKDMVDAGQTPFEIADSLIASGVTHASIDRATLTHTLNVLGMLRKLVGNNENEKWTGSVLTMQDAIVASGDTDSIAAIQLWLSHITNVTNEKWDTTLPEYAAGFWLMYGTFGDLPTMPSLADFEIIASLGGGWKYATVTPADVQTCIDDEAVRAESEAIQTIQSDGQTSAIDTFTDVETAADVVKAVTVDPARARMSKSVELISSLDTTGMSAAEVQAYVDSVLASPTGEPA
jgi:hypothetical protein